MSRGQIVPLPGAAAICRRDPSRRIGCVLCGASRDRLDGEVIRLLVCPTCRDREPAELVAWADRQLGNPSPDPPAAAATR